MVKVIKKISKRLSLFLAACIIIAGILEITGATHIFHKKVEITTHPTPTSGGASTNSQKGEPSVTETSKNSNSPQPGDQKSSTGSSTKINLLTPSGDFVSAHGSSTYPINADTALASVCNTSPGVVCAISFNSSGITKSLPEQSTDRGGSTYWNSWTPKSIGLTAGSWQVKAVAISGSQSKTAADAMELVVAP